VSYRIVANSSINDNVWHSIECIKSAAALTIKVDAALQGQVTLPPGLTISNDVPVRIGGKNLDPQNVQFFGAVDNVYFHLG
jgi:invasion protein IalB